MFTVRRMIALCYMIIHHTGNETAVVVYTPMFVFPVKLVLVDIDGLWL